MRSLIPRPTSKFVKVVCSKCKNEQVIFDKAAQKVNCLVCDNILAENTGGKVNFKSRIVQTLS